MPVSPSLTSSPRQLVQALRLSAASQRPPNPATLLTLRVRIMGGDIFKTNVPLAPDQLWDAPNLSFFWMEKNAALGSSVSDKIDNKFIILTLHPLVTLKYYTVATKFWNI